MGVARVALVGFSGAGKSTVARACADALGWRLMDTDAVIEQRAGRSIPDIFRDDGESAFREREQHVLDEALDQTQTIIATGGGAVIRDDIWTEDGLGAPETLTVLLDAPAEVLLARLQAQQDADPAGARRPMLAGDDPLARITALRERRMPWYRRADMVIPVDGRAVGEIAAMIAAAASAGVDRTVSLDVPGGTSTIRVGNGVIAQLDETIRGQWPRARTLWIAADANVAECHLERVAAGTAGPGLEVRTVTFPAGEGSKSLSGLGTLYDAMLGAGIERTDVVVALGGGVAGDLVGFAAATVLRGVGLVQVPTSLLAMVDSSVGGKTGINHPAGKNLIGAFYQPAQVLIDPELLHTLPEREYRSGWGEIIKHGLIEPSTPAGDSGLSALIADNAGALAAGTSPLLPAIIARNVEIKASVVRADEREAGLRAILNFGHTIGHAVEAAGYRLLHGEAVAVGLHGVMRLGAALGRIAPSRADEVAGLLERFGLPVTVAADVDEVRRLMHSDKKRVAGEQQWVLPLAEGGVTIERGVPDDAITAALGAVVRGSADPGPSAGRIRGESS